MSAKDQKVKRAAQPCLDAIVQLRRAQQLPAPQLLNQRMRGLVDRMAHELQTTIGRKETEDIKYAIVALIDEVAQGHDALGHFWLESPLQNHYFQEFSAGEGFYQRLDELRSGPMVPEVLRVYYECLLLGFQGMMAVPGAEHQRIALIEAVREDLARQGYKNPDSLSRSAERPNETTKRERRRIWVLMLPVAMAVVALGAYVAMQVSVNATISETIELLTMEQGIQDES